METENRVDIVAKKEFIAADLTASNANREAHDANVLLKEYKSQKDRLANWKSIMSTAPVMMFTFIFIVVSIGEYLISKEIYREFNENIPWLIAIVFFIAGVFVSEFLVYKLFVQKRNWKFYELKRDPNNQGTVDELNEHIKKISNKFFIFGLVLGILLVSAIGFLSYKRVQEEVAAGMREDGFGIMDIMPVLLYIIEIISGAFVVYLLNELSLSFRVSQLWKKFNKKVYSCNRLTVGAVKKYQDAEKEDYDPVEVMVSENIHTAFYRNNTFALDNKEEYISVPTKINDVFNLHLTDQNGNPQMKHVVIITDYKFTASGSTNKEGRLSLEVIGTYPDDTCKHIFIKDTATATEYLRIAGDYDLSVDKVHEIII